jgi:glutathione S-transferase
VGSVLLIVIADPASDHNDKPTYVADSFKIALYLDEKYPTRPLFPPGTRPLHSLFTERFSTFLLPLAPTMLPLVGRPGFLDDRGEEYYRRTRQERYGKTFEQLAEEGRQKWHEVHEKWDTLGELLDLNKGPGEAGPFVMGSQISYADLVIVAAFCWIRRAESEEVKLWQEISQWQSGRWETLWNEVEKVIGKFYEEV